MNTTNFLLILLCSCLILCFILMLLQNTDNTTKNIRSSVEGFQPTVTSNSIQDPVLNAIQSQLELESPEALKSTVKALQQRLIDYGYAPDLNSFVKKTELGPNDGKCLVNKAEDRDKYISKSDIPLPGPRIDLSQYVKKSSIPPEKVCPPMPEIDYSAYVKKSTLPPNEKCAPCIAPKVKVSAGLCRECPPAPSCPPPERCPVKKCPVPAPCPAEKKCPQPAPCPAQKKCPEPAPCPTLEKCKSCDEIRYIKVPAVITKTVMVDENGNVISQKVDSGSTNPTESNTPSAEEVYRQGEKIIKELRRELRKEKEENRYYKDQKPTTTEVSLMPQLPTMPQSITQSISQSIPQSISQSMTQLMSQITPQSMPSSTQTQSMPSSTQIQSMPSTTQSLPTVQQILENPSTTQSDSILNSMFGTNKNKIPTTIFSQNRIAPTACAQNQIPTTTFPQQHTCNNNKFGSKKAFCSACELNSEFKSYGIYGPP